MPGHTPEVLIEDRVRRRVVLAEQDGLVAAGGEADLDAADAGEQACTFSRVLGGFFGDGVCVRVSVRVKPDPVACPGAPCAPTGTHASVRP